MASMTPYGCIVVGTDGSALSDPTVARASFLAAAEEADRISATDGAVGGHAARVRGEERDDDDEVDRPSGTAPTAGTNQTGRRRGPVVTEIPSDLLPTRRPARDEGARDEGLDAYNAYLAELARKDRADGTHQEKPAT